jgi:hypothetical protein
MTDKSRLRSILPFLAGYALLYFAVPFPSFFNMRAAETGLLLYTLYIINPALAFGLNILYTIRNRFYWPLPLLAGALFAVSVPVYYNRTAIIYIFSYIALGYVGAAAGYSVRKNKGGGA